MSTQKPREVSLDFTTGNVRVQLEDGTSQSHPVTSKDGFHWMAQAWLRAGWDAKYVYSFSWFGRPVIQLPDDMIRIQEIIWEVRPDVIVETGVAHGGSLIFYASLLKAMDAGRVVGIDIEIRPHNRKAIEAHPLSHLITLVEGSSTDGKIVEQVKSLIKPGEKVLVLLDSNHTKEHVQAELEAYSPLVTRGSYIVAMDGIMRDVAGAPRTQADWTWNNPVTAANEFKAAHPEFELIDPPPPFNEALATTPVTYWPSGYLRRR